MFAAACIMFGLNLPTPVSGAELLEPALRWNALEATVRIVPTAQGGETGSAVCIGHRGVFAYLLTASHVVPDPQVAAFEFFDRTRYPKPALRLEGASLVARSAAADLAILKIVVGEEPPASLPLAAIGQRPKRFPVQTIAIGCPGAVAPQARPQTIRAKKLVRQPKLPGSVAFFWEMADIPLGGMSGGPLLDANGFIIGICVAHQGGRGYFSHTDEIHALLQDHSLGNLFTGGNPKADR